jgi:N-acylglucosamine-6-phosphate 2-epimerase
VDHGLIQSLRGGLIVSCQAYVGEPMRDPRIMTAMAEAAALGGAAGIRAQGLDDIRSMRQALQLPLIGLLKVGTQGVNITPTVADCVAVAAAGADIVALDGTTRPRPDRSTLAEIVAAAHAHGALVMADCGCVDDAQASLEAGADCIATTLAGYTEARLRTKGPDFELLRALVNMTGVPVFAEGRIRHSADAARCLRIGAHAVVVGSAITHPTSITKAFALALADQSNGNESAEMPPPQPCMKTAWSGS